MNKDLGLPPKAERPVCLVRQAAERRHGQRQRQHVAHESHFVAGEGEGPARKWQPCEGTFQRTTTKCEEGRKKDCRKWPNRKGCDNAAGSVRGTTNEARATLAPYHRRRERRAARAPMDDHLASVRARLSGLAQAAEVSALQVALAATVRERMERIDSIMGEPAASAAEDSEVEEWRRKIEALSKPVVVTRLESPDHQSLIVEEEPEAAPSSQEICRLVSTDATVQLPEPHVRAVWCCCA